MSAMLILPTAVTSPLTATIPPGACVIPLAEEITAWVVDTFPTNAAYQSWYDWLPSEHRLALAWVSGVIGKVDAGWPAGAVETAYAETTAQRDMWALYDHLTDPSGKEV